MLGLAKMPEQVFIYRDVQSKASWEEQGAVPQNRHSMIHLALDATSLAVVVDDPNELQTASILESIDQIACDLRQLRFEVAA